MKFVLFTITLWIGYYGYSQQRMAFDLTYKSQGINGNVSYQNAFFKNVFFNTGLALGNFGKSYISPYSAEVAIGHLVHPYSPNTVNSGDLNLNDYTSKNNAIGVVAGVGVFKEFSIKHGLKFTLNTKVLVNFQETTYRYGEGINGIRFKSFQTIYVGCLSPEIVHTIRLSGRTTFNYGFKFPYFFSLDKGKYNPHYRNDIFQGFEPELSLGFTYAIGKCN